MQRADGNELPGLDGAGGRASGRCSRRRFLRVAAAAALVPAARRRSFQAEGDGCGEIEVPARPVRPRRHTRLVFRASGAPDGASVRGRIDGGPWIDMPPHPAVSPASRRILPHRFVLEADTRAVPPGDRTLTVEVAGGGGRCSRTAKVPFAARGAGRTPVIYCTDLYHPHEDPDDHFDLATIFAMPELDVRAIVLDDGVRQKKEPGAIPVRQMLEISGRDVPFASGLAPKLRSPEDAARDQPEDLQGGVRLILETLRASADPVAVVAVGSLRDVAAAWNREPGLCAEKIDRIFAFIGDAHSSEGFGFREYNATLDPFAYRAVMESGLHVFWVPCFDGGPWKNDGRASFWQAEHRDLLRDVADPVKQYFIHALLRKSVPDPVAWLREPVDPAEWEGVLAMRRNLWCCAVFAAISDRDFGRVGDSWTSAAPGAAPDGEPVEPFSFERALLRVDDTGLALYPEALPRFAVERFRVADPATYARAMTSLTAEILTKLGRGRSGT